MAIHAGLFSGRPKIWPANLSLLCRTISDKLPKSTLRKTSCTSEVQIMYTNFVAA